MRRLTSLAVALACALLLAAGCGGGGGGDDRLTKEEWIAQADAICKRAGDEIDALGTPASLDQISEFATKAVEISRRELAEIRALKPPEEDEATINEILGVVEQALAAGEKIADAAAAGDLAKVQELATEGQTINDEAGKLASDYGLKECGQETS